MTNTSNPLSKLPLKGSGKGPKFPEDVTGISVQDYIEDVENMVADVPQINTDAMKKEALLRYLESSVKRDWKAIEGYEPDETYEDFRKNILASYDHTETVSIKGFDQMLKGYYGVKISDLDRILGLKRSMGPYKKDLIDKNKISNREVVQKILKTIDGSLCASVWKDLARSECQKEDQAVVDGHTWTNDDPIGITELLKELELQARIYDSENQVMGTSYVRGGSSNRQSGSETKVKLEQQENDLALLKDAFTVSQKQSEHRHKELLEKMVKMHQEIFTHQRVAAPYNARPAQTGGGGQAIQPMTYQPRNVDGMIRDLTCWFCGEKGHMSGRCMVRQRYIDDGKIILKGSTVCLPNGQAIHYSQGKDFQMLQVDKISKGTAQTNLMKLTEEDFAGTPIEEVQAYLETMRERNTISQMLHQLQNPSFDDDDEEEGALEERGIVNLQTRSQKAQNEAEKDF